jgi:prepilin-type N-terminal cleavage/methylation domain-containing protein
MTHRRRTPGFTLVEVMLALAILVSITALVWGSISYSFQSRDRMMGAFDQFQQIRLAVDRMSREFSMAFVTRHANRREHLPGVDDLDGEDQEALVGQLVQGEDAAALEQELQGEARDRYIETAFVGKDDEVHFTSLSHVRTQPGELASDQCEISYIVRNAKQRSPDGRLRRELIRREDSSLDDDVESGGVIYTLIDDVEDVKFEFWEEGEEGDEEASGRWTNAWDSRKGDQKGKLPNRVKITIDVAVPGTERKAKRTFVTQAPIVMNRMLDF